MTVLDWLLYPFKPQRRPLADARPERVEMGNRALGTEATDLDLVNRVARRNDALERTTDVNGANSVAGTSGSSLHVAPMPEDETYAARYHRVFAKKGEIK
jgi:hypothetical protein